jgi:hypothetical protein
MPFSTLTQINFEQQSCILCLENEAGDKVFFRFEDGEWQPRKLDVSSKYQIIKLFEKFIIAYI